MLFEQKSRRKSLRFALEIKRSNTHFLIRFPLRFLAVGNNLYSYALRAEIYGEI